VHGVARFGSISQESLEALGLDGPIGDFVLAKGGPRLDFGEQMIYRERARRVLDLEIVYAD
jgi:hypothetical protein